VSERTEFHIELSRRHEVMALASELDGAFVLSLGGLLELLLAATGAQAGSVVLADVEFQEPVTIGDGRALVLDVVAGTGAFSLHDATASTDAEWPSTEYLRGTANPDMPPSHDVAAICDESMRRDTYDGATFHRLLAEVGLEQGPQLRSCDRVEVDTRAARARLTLKPEPPDAQLRHASAAVLDTALQLAAFLGVVDGTQRSRVLGVARVQRGRSQRAPAAVFVERAAATATDASSVCDVRIVDDAGALHTALLGVRLEAAQRQRERRVQRCEAAIVRAARSLLVKSDIGPDDDLIAAGASSMDVVRLVGLLSRVHGRAPEIERIFADPRPSSIARACFSRDAVASAEAGHDRESRAAQPGDAAPDGMLARAEKRLWYLERYARVSPAYNESIAWSIEGELDERALRASVAAVVARHESLRTVFVERDGEPYRVVGAHRGFELEVIDLAGHDGVGARSPEALRDVLRDEVRRPFAATSPMFRAVLVRVGANRRVLLLVAHHMVCDAWSVARIVQAELQAAYGALVGEGALPESPAALQASDYARLESARLAARGDDLIAWWVKTLGDAPTVLELPTDRPRPHALSHRGARFAAALDPELSAGLAAFSRARGVSPFMVLLAAFRVLVFRYTEADKALIGIPVSLRQWPGSERIVGCLVNTIPLRIDLTAGTSLSGVVEAVKGVLGSAIGRAEVPFEALATAMRCARSASQTPLVQVGFSYQDVLGADLRLLGVSTAELPVSSGTSKFELMLEVRRRNADVSLEFEYNTDLFDEPRIARMSRHFVRILRQTLEQPQRTVGDARLLDRDESALLRRWGTGAEVEVAADALRRAIDHNLDTAGARIALAGEGFELTYAELGRAVDALASRLQRLDPGPNRVLALCTGRTPEWAIGALAAARLGWGYLPIDPETPLLRAQKILQQCQARVLAYRGDACPWAGAFDGHAIRIGAPSEAAEERAAAPAPFADDATMYAISTSGSTGEPKLAAVAHAGFANLVEWYRRALALDADARVLVVTSVAFDIAQKNLFAALGAGARVVLAPEGLFDPRRLAELIARTAASVINATPSLMNSLLDACAPSGYAALRSLRHVVLGGEPVDARAIGAWLQAAGDPPVTIWNTYGPTECSDVVSAWAGRCTPGLRVPIGRPLPNVRLHVLDRELREVPVGVSGELCITGVAVGKGYLGDPAATASAFVRLPSGELVYRTGDIVRYGEDGSLQYEGRRDQQLKVRGYRIELAEIEAVLRGYPGVLEAAAVLRSFGDGSASIHAYYTSAAEIDASAVLLWARQVLPRYMVPASLRKTNAIPKTPSGKVDRKALAIETPGALSAREPPAVDRLEAELLRIWREGLESPLLTRSDDFFEAGGHSLLAVRLAQLAGETCGCACSVQDLVDHPTVEHLASLLRDRLARAGQRGA
jgi:amino acid adenylation domain-containing protein